MRDTLKVGLTHQHSFKVSTNQTVPNLYPESELFLDMPHVFATGYMVGLLEWACIELLREYLDWPNEQTLGTHVNFSHEAPTLPGATVVVNAELTKIQGRTLTFSVEAHDGLDTISRGTHERVVIFRERFIEKLKMREIKADKHN